MKIGDRIIVTNRGEYGIVITDPIMILNTQCVGIKFDNAECNIFDPYYCPVELLELVQ